MYAYICHTQAASCKLVKSCLRLCTTQQQDAHTRCKPFHKMSKYISSFTFISRAVDRHSPEEPFCCRYKLYNYDYITFVNSLKQIAFFACWQQSGAIDAVGQSTVRDSQRLCQQVKLKTIKYFICHSNASLPRCQPVDRREWNVKFISLFNDCRWHSPLQCGRGPFVVFY